MSVTPETAPTMAAIRDKGVNFANPHSLFPTFTMPNASGHVDRPFPRRHRRLQQHDLSPAYPVAAAAGSVTPFIESDPVLGDIDEHFAGNFVDEEPILLDRPRTRASAPPRSASSARR